MIGFCCNTSGFLFQDFDPAKGDPHGIGGSTINHLHRTSTGSLLSELLVKEPWHDIQRFLRFRQVIVVPERVRQRFEHDELRIHPGVQECPVKNGRPTYQEVTRAGDKQRRREALQVRIERREYRVSGIRRTDVRSVERALRRRREVAGKSVDGVESLGIGRLAQIPGS